MTWYTLDVGTFWIVAPGILQGLGMGMMFVPLSTLAYQTMPKERTDEAASVFNLFRTIGGSIGIAIAATILTRQTHASAETLAANISPGNPALGRWLDSAGLALSDPHAAQMIAAELSRQATMIGFIDAFVYVTLSFLALVPLALMLRPLRGRK